MTHEENADEHGANEHGGDEHGANERDNEHGDVSRTAWARTLADAEEIAAERTSNGWSTVLAQAGETTLYAGESAAEAPTLELLIPDTAADRISGWVSEGEFPRYDVHRGTVAGRVFLSIELLDPDRKRCVLLVSTYEVATAGDAYRAAVRNERLLTRLRRLDQTTVATFEHRDVTKFFSDGIDAVAGRGGNADT